MAYATAAHLRDWLKIPQGDTGASEKLNRALAAAIEAVDDYCGRSFGTVTEDQESAARIFEAWSDRVLIDDAAEVTVVEQSSDRRTWSAVSTSDWWTEPATTPVTTVRCLYRIGPFVQVTATWGHGTDVPARVTQATIMKAARIYQRHQSTTGVEGVGDFGVIRITRSADPDVCELLDPLRRTDKTTGIA